MRTSQPSIPPNQLLAWYRSGKISQQQWRDGMQLQFILALKEIQQDRSQPKLALLENWRCRAAAKRLLRDSSEAELREVMMALAEIEDFSPAVYLWNADQRSTPLHCFLREKREPVLRFSKMQISRLRAELCIEYGGCKNKNSSKENIILRRDWRGTLVLESRTHP